jgi:hypothetical protein
MTRKYQRMPRFEAQWTPGTLAIDGLLNDEATTIIGRDDEAKDVAGGKEDAVNLGIATKRTTLLEKVSELRETIVVGLLLADN